MEQTSTAFRTGRWAGHLLLACLATVTLGSALWAAEPGGGLDISGFEPPAPGEHPRLFFRKKDVAAMRQRAATPEGKAIVARLKLTLGGGEEMPTKYNTAKKDGETKGDLPLGTYTLGHAAGFGLLYQLTGEKTYADLARECMDKAIEEGVRDIDDRNAWQPASAIRTGPVLAQLALGYDLAYDGWPADYRASIAKKIQDFSAKGTKKGEACSLEDSATRGGKLGPHSNHFGCHVGGAGIAILAIKGDPGTDDAKLTKWLQSTYSNTEKALTEGYSEAGYFHEHAGPMQIALGQTFQPWLQVAKVAGGKDFIGKYLSAQMCTLRIVHETVRQNGKPWMMNHNANGGYGDAYLRRDGASHGGQFSQGFGAILPEHQAALLWTYKNFVEPDEKALHKNFMPDTTPSMDVMVYPSRAAMALSSWPIGVAPADPATVLPKVRKDTKYHRWLFRNRWKDQDDCVVAALFGARGDGGTRRLMVAGLGQMAELDGFPAGSVSGGTAYEDGSGVVSAGAAALAVDMSGSSGADLLIVVSGVSLTLKPIAERGGEPAKVMKTTQLTLGGKAVTVLTVAKTHPEAKVEGDAIVVGKQKITLKDNALSLAVTAAPLKQ